MTTYNDMIDSFISSHQKVFIGVDNEIFEGIIYTRGDNFIELQRKWETSVTTTIWQYLIPTSKIQFIRVIHEIKKETYIVEHI